MMKGKFFSILVANKLSKAKDCIYANIPDQEICIEFQIFSLFLKNEKIVSKNCLKFFLLGFEIFLWRIQNLWFSSIFNEFKTDEENMRPYSRIREE